MHYPPAEGVFQVHKSISDIWGLAQFALIWSFDGSDAETGNAVGQVLMWWICILRRGVVNFIQEARWCVFCEVARGCEFLSKPYLGSEYFHSNEWPGGKTVKGVHQIIMVQYYSHIIYWFLVRWVHSWRQQCILREQKSLFLFWTWRPLERESRDRRDFLGQFATSPPVPTNPGLNSLVKCGPGRPKG